MTCSPSSSTPSLSAETRSSARAQAREAVFVGTYFGGFAGIAATGKEVTVPYSVFYELEDGKITNLRIDALVEGIVQQLQVAPA